MADADELKSAMKSLFAAYPSVHPSRDTLMEYLFALEDIPGDILQRAVHACIRTSQWFPKISDVYRSALKMAGVSNFYQPAECAYRSLLAEQIELQAATARGEPLDESAWLSLAEKYREAGYSQAYGQTLKRLASYKAPREGITTQEISKEERDEQEELPS